ncbi:MAG: DinB family protein [Chloroflexota bacterium]
MVEIGDPFSKVEILATLRMVNQTVAEYFAGLSPEVFFAHPVGVWSPAENVEHLCLSGGARIEPLSGSREALRQQYGVAERPSRHYAEIRETYRNFLANGGVAGPTVTPHIDDHPADAKASQDALLAKYRQVCQAIVTAAEGWSETDLDTFQMEHRLLGILTVREMLLWMTYHNLHHMEDARRLVEGG